MNPEDVPVELVEKAARGLARLRSVELPLGVNEPWQRYEYEARVALADVLPLAQADAWDAGQAAGLAEANRMRILGHARPGLNPYRANQAVRSDA